MSGPQQIVLEMGICCGKTAVMQKPQAHYWCDRGYLSIIITLVELFFSTGHQITDTDIIIKSENVRVQ